MDEPNAGTRGPAPANPGLLAVASDPVNPLGGAPGQPRAAPGPPAAAGGAQAPASW